MNNTRIRYKKLGNLLTSKPITVLDRFITVSIDTHTFTYRLTNSEGEVVGEGQTATLTKTKSKVKSVLTSMGAIFFNEVRRRDNLKDVDAGLLLLPDSPDFYRGRDETYSTDTLVNSTDDDDSTF